ncbi:MAG: hypothetical protein HRT45_02375 [Bdellovibrionales bacterium]|nr:hypothetical protein [Bdellovibrionales bacterium]
MAVSLFVGGAIKTFLGPKQIRQFIETNLRQRPLKFDLIFDEARLSLASGWLPRLGLELDNVTIRAKDICDTDLQVRINSVYVPIYLLKLINQQMKFKPIQFGTVELSKRSGDECIRPSGLAASGAQPVSPGEGEKSEQKDKNETTDAEVSSELKQIAAQPIDAFMEKFNRFILTRWKKELKNTSEQIDGFSVERLLIVGLLPKDVEVHFDAIEALVDSDGSDAELQFDVKIKSEQMKMIPVDVFHFNIEVDPKVLNFEMQTGFKEGRWSLEGRLDLRKSHLNMQSQFDHFPLSEVLARLVEAKIIQDVGDYPRTVWASCQQSTDGSLIQWKDLTIDYSRCAVHGDLGSLVVKDGQYSPFASQALPGGVEMEIQNFSLRRFLEGLGVRGTRGLVQKHGQLSGLMTLKSFEDIVFDGNIEGFGLIFSRRGRRFVQPFEKAVGEIRYKDGRVSAVLKDAELKSGRFKGQVSVNFDKTLKNGLFQSNVSSLEFHPKVTALLLDGGEVSNIEVYGKGQVENGKIVQWSGSLGLAKLVSEEMVLDVVKTKSLWGEGSLSGEMSIAGLEFGARQPLYGLFKPLYLGELQDGEKIKWSDVKTSFEIKQKRIEWKGTKAIDTQKQIQFFSEGRRLEDDTLQGQISVDFEKFDLLSWNLTGAQSEPLLTPTEKVIQQLAVDQPNFAKPFSVKIERSSGLFAKLREFGQNLSMSRLRDQVVNSAKSLIPSSPEQPSKAEAAQDESREQPN